MSDGDIGVNEPDTAAIDKKIDTEVVSVGGEDKHRERVRIGGTTDIGLADVTADFGLEVDVKRIDPPTGFNGDQLTNIGTTPVELTFTGTTKTITIKSASTNTGLIWFGPSNIDNTGANAIGELTPNASVEIEIDDASAAIYVVSDTASQTVYKAALT